MNVKAVQDGDERKRKYASDSIWFSRETIRATARVRPSAQRQRLQHEL